MIIRDVIREASKFISVRDSEVLLRHTLKRERTWLIAHDNATVADTDLIPFRAQVARRAAGEPLQYITGEQEFFGLLLEVTPAVLIPRQETEHLVSSVLHWLEGFDGKPQIVDVGTGSGAITVALATFRPDAAMTAIDISLPALNLARQNAERHFVADRISFQEGDLLTGLAAHSYDIIVSNPPYVPFADAASMQKEVVGHEPHTALFAAEDGLSIYRRLIPQALQCLRPGGLLAMEIGFGQQAAVERLLSSWNKVRTLPDYAGIPRVVLAIKA